MANRLLCLLYAALASASDALVNREVVQTFDPFQSYVRHSVEVTVENTGEAEQSFYTFVLPLERADTVALVDARDTVSNQPLRVHKVVDGSDEASAAQGLAEWQIAFASALAPGSRAELGIAVAYAGGVEPLPPSARQSDTQFVVFRNERQYVSVYHTDHQETQVRMLTEGYEILDNLAAPTFDPTGLLIYGAYDDVAPGARDPLVLRFMTPVPQIRVEQLRSSLWVSHWGGTVSIDDSYDVHNVGTRLDGSFSRKDFVLSRGATHSLNAASLRGFSLPLPEGHREEYYIDLVGNVSTSAITENSLEVVPRYPVMGGWFYNFTVGYACDIGEFVHKASANSFIVEVPLVAGPNYVHYGSVLRTVVLPEGATNVEVVSPLEPDSVEESKLYSYLDLYGRPTVTVEFKNVVADMAGITFYVTYQYSVFTALRKPLSYFLTILALLVSVKVLITKSKK